MPRIKFISLEDLLEMFVNKEKFRLVEVLAKKTIREATFSAASISLSMS
jgi:hypothetical protein